MRIAYVGNFEPEWSTENDVRIALESMGHEVIQLQENRARYRAIRATAFECDLLLWTTTWDDAQPLNETLDTIHILARNGIPSAAYHLDTFWQTEREKRRWWRNPMWQVGHVFTADGDFQRCFDNSGIRHHWLPAGVRHTAAIDGTPRKEFACDVAFAGSDGINVGYHPEWPYRAQLIQALKKMCHRRHWRFRNPGGRDPKIGRQDMADFYASAKVTVGDSLCTRKERSRYWSDRAYEAPGRNALLIMPDLPALAEHYDDNLPMYPWGDFKTLERSIAYLLEDGGERDTTRKLCSSIARAEHTYVNRMQDLLTTVIR